MRGRERKKDKKLEKDRKFERKEWILSDEMRKSETSESKRKNEIVMWIVYMCSRGDKAHFLNSSIFIEFFSSTECAVSPNIQVAHEIITVSYDHRSWYDEPTMLSSRISHSFFGSRIYTENLSTQINTIWLIFIARYNFIIIFFFNRNSYEN